MENTEELKKRIADFRASIENFTLEQLEEKSKEIQDKISRMILDSDLMLEAAIVDTLIKEKEKELRKVDA